MKAARIHHFGGPEALVIEEAPRPNPAPGEVLIRVHAAGVNPVDWKTCAGRGLARRDKLALPFIPGWDVSGTIEQVGQGVQLFKPGDAVYGLVRFPLPGSTFAEYVAAPADQLCAKPASLDHVYAAALPLVALTAWQALFEAAHLKAGQRILIHAAAGGVGHIAVQLARWMGASVIGTGAGYNAEFIVQVGAHEVIDYEAAPFEDRVRNMDVVLDTLAGETRDRSWQVLARNGILVSILGAPSAEAAAQYGVRATSMMVRPDRAQLAEITRLVEQGLLTPAVSAVLPLESARAALECVRTGHTRGKIVLQMV